jgi:hypothetical protein
MPPLTEPEQQLLLQIEAYMYYANLFCMTLQEVSGLKFTRCSRTERNTVLSQRGTIQGLTYAFHGRGCYFQTTRQQRRDTRPLRVCQQIIHAPSYQSLLTPPSLFPAPYVG